MSKNELVEKNINVGATLLCLILLIILTAKFGVIGAAIAFSSSRFIANLTKLYFTKKKLGIKTLTKAHLKILILQIIILIVLMLGHNIYMQVILYITLVSLFVIIIFKLSWISFSEIDQLHKI